MNSGARCSGRERGGGVSAQLAVEEHDQSYKAIEAEGCEINALTPKEHEAFVASVQPLLAEARKTYGDAMFRMVPKA